MLDHSPFQPDWVSPPGDTIADLLEEQGFNQAELASRTGFSKKHISDLVRGLASINAETALRLESVFGATAQFWLTRESQYREALARREAEAALESEGEWLKCLPWKDLVDFGWVESVKGTGRRVAACLRFFGVASVDAWRARYGNPLAAFRTSKAFSANPGAVAAWLRRGEIEAAAIRCGPWDPDGFRETLGEIRSLTREPDPNVFVPRLVSLCAAKGVAVAIVRAPRGCRASGATKFLSPDKAMMLLSFRFLSDDHLWFSFFHEAGHLLKHGKKTLFIEGVGMTSEEEDQADSFARDILIPPNEAEQLGLFRSAKSVQRFAAEVGVSPGIVVGRLQHDGHLGPARLNELKVRYQWMSDGSPENS